MMPRKIDIISVDLGWVVWLLEGYKPVPIRTYLIF